MGFEFNLTDFNIVFGSLFGFFGAVWSIRKGLEVIYG
jgi:hypothetical protein